jgi:hypothetical protein
MKVIVKVPGFYAGAWFEAGEAEMHEKIAKRFLPPYGDQLAVVDVAKQEEKPAPKTSEPKPVEPRSGDTKKLR